MDNNHTGWRQGMFIDKREYDHMPKSWKNKRSDEELLLVRPSPLGNAICNCTDPDMARWIAGRLNVAAELESKISEMKEIKKTSTNTQSESLLCGRESECKNYGDRCANCSRRYRDLYWTW